MSQVTAPIHGPLTDPTTGNATPAFAAYLNQTVSQKLSSTPVGASLPASTLTGTYATDAPTLQALQAKVVALEAALKAQTLVHS